MNRLQTIESGRTGRHLHTLRAPVRRILEADRRAAAIARAAAIEVLG